MAFATEAEVVVAFAEVELCQRKAQLVVAWRLVDHGLGKLFSLLNLEVQGLGVLE